MNERINMIDLKLELADIGDEIRAAVNASLDETIFINGPRVKKFEKDAAEFLGVRHAIGVANGTDSLRIAYLAMGIGEGDEIIMPSFTFFATAEMATCIGAKPVYVDIDEKTLNMDAALIEKAITANTKAIVPVHIFGLACNMDEIVKIAEKHNLQIIEDCAQSFGATVNGMMTGSIGGIGSYSFYPTKNLGAYGDAGMLTTNDDDFAERCKMYREHGSAKRYYHKLIGFNSRLDDIQAAILGVKLKYIDRFNSERRRIAALYREHLGSAVRYQEAQAGAYHIYHQFTILANNRDEIIAALEKENIASSIFYPVPCHLQESMAYLGYKDGDLPVTEHVAKQVVSLPINPYLTDDEVIRVANIVKKIAR